MRYLMLLSLLFVLFSFSGTSGETVYICVSKSSVAYHLNKECRGIKQCKAEIKAVSRNHAINTYGRKLCGYED